MLTNKQQKDLEAVIYFIPEVLKHVPITDEDTQMFFEYSDKGMHKDKAITGAMATNHNGFTALCEGKRWRGIHVHEMYEPGVLDGSMPYFTLLGGFDKVIYRKWWQFWKPKYKLVHTPMPRAVVDFLKKEMFKGKDADTIEMCYTSIVEEYKTS